jgi:hypothetical protein
MGNLEAKRLALGMKHWLRTAWITWFAVRASVIVTVITVIIIV